VLVIDDEPLVLNAVRRILSAHETVCVGEPREALARLLAGDTFDVILCDLLMPSLSGREIFEELTRFRPELAARMVFLTGQRADDVTESFLGSFSNPVLEKPFEPELLRSTVASVLED
jgi:CheY-like chemotaxis protein